MTLRDMENEIQNQSARNESTQDDQEASTDFEREIHRRMDERKAVQDRESIALEHEEIMRNCSNMLGEKETKRKSRKGTMEDEDEDLEVLNPSSSSANELKCPITQALFKNPVRSKVCGHVYDEEATKHCIASGRGKMACPIPGCNNRNVTREQLERDVQTALKLKLHLRRMESSAKKQRTDNVLEDDDDVKDSGTTIIE
jgi:SUMO ligase MMS21 Smc5/6 complex component